MVVAAETTCVYGLGESDRLYLGHARFSWCYRWFVRCYCWWKLGIKLFKIMFLNLFGG